MLKEEFDKNVLSETTYEEDVLSIPIKAGKRIYFIDIKATKGRKDFYITITERKRQTLNNGKIVSSKSKIFLFKEDFDKFSNGLLEAITYIKQLCENGKIANNVDFEVNHEFLIDNGSKNVDFDEA